MEKYNVLFCKMIICNGESSMSEGISLFLIMSGMQSLGKLAVISEQWYFIYCDRLNNQQDAEQNNVEPVLLLNQCKIYRNNSFFKIVIPSPKFCFIFKVKRHFNLALIQCNENAEDAQSNASLLREFKIHKRECNG